LALNSLYTFFYDAKGNVIGVTDASSNYVVIDSIYTETASGNATVTANLVKPDATKLSGKVHTINNSTILNVDADKTKNTGAYYHQLYTYTTNTDGTYNLNRTGYEAVAARYTAGSLNSMPTALVYRLAPARSSCSRARIPRMERLPLIPATTSSVLQW
jgi:hypothetical protein